MTPGQKAAATRKRHMESQKKKALEEKRIRASIVKSCLEILEDENSSADLKMEAVRALNEVRQ